MPRSGCSLRYQLQGNPNGECLPPYYNLSHLYPCSHPYDYQHSSPGLPPTHHVGPGDQRSQHKPLLKPRPTSRRVLVKVKVERKYTYNHFLSEKKTFDDVVCLERSCSSLAVMCSTHRNGNVVRVTALLSLGISSVSGDARSSHPDDLSVSVQVWAGESGSQTSLPARRKATGPRGNYATQKGKDLLWNSNQWCSVNKH